MHLYCKCIILSSLLFLSVLSYSQKPLQGNATLTNATVYYGYGAELQQHAKIPLSAGTQEVIINDISNNIDENTVQIACPENVTLLSYRYNVIRDTTKAIIDPIVEKMKDSIKSISKQIVIVSNDEAIQKEILKKTSKIIEANLSNNPAKNITAAELIKLIDYYNNKIINIQNIIFALKQKKELLNDSVIIITARKTLREETLQKIQIKNKGQLVLQVKANTSETINFDISYFTKNAGWLPTYDMRVKTIDNSFKLVYKATLTQTTGIDWKQVKLTLSTSNPNQNNTQPILNAWFVDVYIPNIYQNALGAKGQTKAVYFNQIQSMDKSLSESIVNGSEGYRINGERDENEYEGNLIKEYTTLSESQLNSNFEIDLPYDIPTDGKGYSVGIKDEMIKATYKHYAVPKLDADAFLLAEISDWEQLSLLPGEANIIMDNVYLGKSFINPNTTADTLNISLGRDKRIAVKRSLVKEFSKSKTRGDSKTDDFTYEIVVKNNKKTPVDLLLKDQYPISKTKEVEVTVTDNGNAEVKEDLGILNWKISLAPGESKKIRFSYSMKYPKDKKIKNS